MSTTLFTNANILDTKAGEILSDRNVLVRDGLIAEVSEGGIAAQPDKKVDVRGRFLMPGMCDGHVHVTAYTADFNALKRQSPFYVMARSAELMEAMLMRGFTTVRDGGGADYGLARAVDEGRIKGPRVLFCGYGLSQTGGHGDMRAPGEQSYDQTYSGPGLGLICDGVPEVRRAARHMVRTGANHIKIMASGGVASPTDRIDSTQFSDEEVDAIVEEAEAANLYVMAHAYTARAINRLITRGVRTIEHGNLMNEESCELFKKHGAYLVPTLATYDALAKEGVEAGMPPELQAKTYNVLDAGAKALELAYTKAVPMAFGTDLLGQMQVHQLNEFHLRKDVVSAADLVRSATCNAAEAFQCEGEFGVVEPDARADLLVLRENPLDDITALTDPDKNLLAIMKDGRFYKNELN